MDIDQSYRDALAAQLSRRLAQALQNKEIPTGEVSAAAEFIIKRMNSLSSHQETLVFLTELSGKWPIFTDFLSREKLSSDINDDAKIAQVEASLSEQEQKEDTNSGN